MTSRVLITGATGFTGSRLARAMVARGDTVHGIRRTTSSLIRLGDIARCITWHESKEAVEETLLAARADVVIHAATHYGRGIGADMDVEIVNLRWPAALLERASTHGTALFVNLDTSLPPALNVYAATKRRFAAHGQALANVDGTRFLNIRLESVYGPGDDPAKFPTALLHALLRNAPSFPLSPGAQTRDYIYVDDAIEAMLLLIDHAHSARTPYLAAGVGRGEEVTIRRFAETMRDMTRSATYLDFGALPYRPGELMRACADTTALRGLGWQGARSLEQGLAEMIAGERVLQ